MLEALALIGGVVVGARALAVLRALLGPRDGNSGRYKHWTEE